MAIAQPAFVAVESGQDASWTVTLSPAEDITGWTIVVTVRAYNGQTPALITKSSANGNSEVEFTSAASGVFVAYFSAADLALASGPGAYVIQAHRTNAGYSYPITDPSCLLIRPADSTSYPTITNLGEYAAHALMGLTLSDALAQQYLQLLFAAEAQVKRYCNRDFPYRSLATEYVDGTGTREILLRRTPVYPSTVAIYEDWNGNYGQTSGSFDATTTALTLGTDYTVPIDSRWNDGLNYSGRVVRLGANWPSLNYRPPGYLGGQRQPLPGCIKAVYTGGYALMPHDLKRAVWQLTTLAAETATTGRLAMSEAGEGYSVGFGNDPTAGGMPPEVATLLSPFRSGTCFVR